jgi:hypothetical protein
MRIPVLLFLTILFSCSSSVESEEPVFFNIKSYISNQVRELKTHHALLQKTVINKGKEETKVISQPDWNKELQAFMECDLNRPGWSASYKTDSLRRDSLLTIRYTAIEPKLRVRMLEIIQLNGDVQEIKAECRQGNTWFTARQQLYFNSGKGYDIRGFQKVVLADSVSYTITANIIRP